MIRCRILGLPWLNKTVYEPGVDKVDRVVCEISLFRKVLWRREPCLKTGASYNLYDGEELLRASALSIRQNVDFINVVYQRVSNFGERRNDLGQFLQALKDEGVIDNYVLYTPDLSLAAPENETRKRELGLDLSRRNGCVYHLDLDCDEFYRAREFAAAKALMYAQKIDYSACAVQDYLNSPECRVCQMPRLFVPFLMRIRRGMRNSRTEYFPCLVDGTRKLANRGKFWMFTPDALAMHHMSLCRKDILRKCRNTSIMQNPQSADVVNAIARIKAVQGYVFGCNGVPDDVDKFAGMVIVKVADEFHVDLRQWEFSERSGADEKKI